MPPVLFIGVSAATYDDGGPGAATMTIAPSTTTRPGDSILAVFAMAEALLDVVAINGEAVADSGWGEIVDLEVGSWKLIVFRRTATDSDPASYVFAFEDVPGPANAMGVALSYRGLSDAAPIGSSGVEISNSTNFACPSRTLTTFSDLYVGIAFASESDPRFTPPDGGRERYDATGSGGVVASLAVFDYQHESSGPTGVQTAIADPLATGIAASIAFAAEGIRGVGKTLVSDVPGAIGLPEDGV